MGKARRAAVALALALLLTSSHSAIAQEKVLGKSKWFDLVAEEELEIHSAEARKLKLEAEKALDATLGLLGVAPSRAFYDRVRTPSWMGKAGKLRVVLMLEVPEKNSGIDYWVTQLYAGGFRLEVPYPEGGVDAAFRGRLWREVGTAVLGNTLYKTNVSWWTEGVLCLLECRGTEDFERLAKMRKKVASIPRDGMFMRYRSMLAAKTPKELAEAGGLELAVVTIDLLSRANVTILHHVQDQLQWMAYHVQAFPNAAGLQKDFLTIADSLLLDHLEVIASGLSAWAKEGYPTGSDLRRVKGLRALRRAKTRKGFGVGLTGTWSRSRVNDSGRTVRHFKGGSASWNLPSLWSKYSLWAGVHKKLPRGQRFKPENMPDGLGISLGKWDLLDSGYRSFPDIEVLCEAYSFKYEFLLLDVTSSAGVQYRYYTYKQTR